MPSIAQRVRSAIKSTQPKTVYVRDPRQAGLLVNNELQNAYKSISYSQYVADFINDEGTGNVNYSEQQVNGAYRSSVYLFAALRLVANMMSTLPVRSQSKDKSGRWRRDPDDDPLNMLFAQQGRQLLRHMYLYNALYGSVLTYKRKTRKALYAERDDKPLWKWADGAIAGLHVIPNVMWQLDEEGYNGLIRGFHVYSYDDYLRNKNYLQRWECVYYNDFDPEQRNVGVAVASLAIHDAVSNAAVARWAAQYFMSGAMPMLLISTGDDPNIGSEADLLRKKNLFERSWQGLWSKFALRAVVTDRKYDVQQVGIKAEDVTAPELDRNALARIASVVGITPDLVVPPEGGSDNARHKYLIKQAWQQTVIPTGEAFLVAIERDFGLYGTNKRLVIAEEDIPALEADRGDIAATEKDLFQSSLETFGEARKRLQLPKTDFDDWLYINQSLISPKALKRGDETVDDKMAQRVDQWWNDDLLMRSEARSMLNLETPPNMPDGFKSQIVAGAMGGSEPTFNPNDKGGGGASGSVTPKAPPDKNPPPSGGGETPPSLPSGGGGQPAPAKPEDKTPPKPPAQAPVEGKDDKQPQPAAPKPKADEAPHKEEGTKDVEAAVKEDEPLVPETPKVEAVTTGQAVPARNAEEELEERLPNPAFIYLDVSDDLLIGRIQQTLQHQFGLEHIHWQTPETYHITLAYIPDITDAQLDQVRKLLPAYYNRLQFHADKVSTFDPRPGTDDSGTPIIILVERDAAMDAIQGAVRTALSAYLLPVSEYSDAEHFTPHITLGYAPVEMAVPEYECGFVVEPKAVCIARSEYKEAHRIRVIPDPSVLLDVVDDSGMKPAFDSAADMALVLSDIYAARQRWLRALNEGQLDALPGRIKVLIQDCLKNSDYSLVIAAACQAVAVGALDDQAVSEGNPIERYMVKSKSPHQDAEEELLAWQKVALKTPTKALKSFETHLVPLAVDTEVRTGLKSAHNNAEVRAVFAKALGVIREMRPRDTGVDHLHDWADHINSLDDADLKSVLAFDDN